MPYFAIVDKNRLMLPVSFIQRLKALSLISDCFDHKVNLLNKLTNYCIIPGFLVVTQFPKYNIFPSVFATHVPAQLTKYDLHVPFNLISLRGRHSFSM